MSDANLSPRELSLKSNTDVQGHIRAENARVAAKAKAEGWTFWTLAAESLADEYANAYELELMFARGAYTDIHKDYVGFKGYVSEELTLAQVERQIEMLCEEANRAYELEQEWLAEQERQDREDIALGVTPPTPDVELEEWEVYEAKAEEAGYGA